MRASTSISMKILRGGASEEVVEDEYEVELPDDPVAVQGDIYQLGRHRLMCGDSTILDDVEKLLDGRKAALVITDPPYNMNYEGGGGTRDRKEKRIPNDNLPEQEFAEFLRTVLSNYYITMEDGASIYCFYKELGGGVFLNALRASGLTFKQVLIWVKNQIVLGGSKYQGMHEPCMFGCKGKVGKWHGARKQRSVIESIDLMSEEDLKNAIRELLDMEMTDILRENKPLKNDLHPTMKPIRLLAKLIGNSSDKDDVVLDLFGGSGSTMIAAEQTGRDAYLMELDPKYVDVIVDRWQKFTGQKAVKVS